MSNEFKKAAILALGALSVATAAQAKTVPQHGNYEHTAEIGEKASPESIAAEKHNRQEVEKSAALIQRLNGGSRGTQPTQTAAHRAQLKASHAHHVATTHDRDDFARRIEAQNAASMRAAGALAKRAQSPPPRVNITRADIAKAHGMAPPAP